MVTGLLIVGFRAGEVKLRCLVSVRDIDGRVGVNSVTDDTSVARSAGCVIQGNGRVGYLLACRAA